MDQNASDARAYVAEYRKAVVMVERAELSRGISPEEHDKRVTREMAAQNALLACPWLRAFDALADDTEDERTIPDRRALFVALSDRVDGLKQENARLRSTAGVNAAIRQRLTDLEDETGAIEVWIDPDKISHFVPSTWIAIALHAQVEYDAISTPPADPR